MRGWRAALALIGGATGVVAPIESAHDVEPLNVTAHNVATQNTPTRSLRASAQPPTPRAARALDEWVVARYRDAQLLPDTVRTSRGAWSAADMPRVESVLDGDAVDTLYAVHVSAVRDTIGVRIGGRGRLVASSGVTAAPEVEVLARRPFRAPTRPVRAGAPDDRPWRYGWAYMAVTRHVGGKSSAQAYRGWMLMLPPDSIRRGHRDPSSPLR